MVCCLLVLGCLHCCLVLFVVNLLLDLGLVTFIWLYGLDFGVVCFYICLRLILWVVLCVTVGSLNSDVIIVD